MLKQKRRKATPAIRPLLKLLRRYPWLLLPLLLVGGAWYGHELYVARPAMAWMGLPQATQLQPAYWTHVLRNEGFLVGYSELRGNPLWVTYRLGAVPESAQRHKRPARFDSDWRSLSRIGHDDYTHSGFSRGHLAPNHAIALLHGRAAQLATFLMTNITPQRAELNTGVWQRLERLELEEYAQRYGTVWVVTGPLFDDAIERLPSALRVEIPDAFYKILAVPAEANHGMPLLRAYRVPQQVPSQARLEEFVTSVDRVEALSGFDFFPELPDELERALEGGAATERDVSLR
ncbi:MAG TPA: DNA/RNA non-specific endonuclease [Gammaproteobacteria bacterium]